MTEIPAVVIILGVFFGILILSRFRVPIGAAILLGAFTLCIMAGHSPGEAFRNLGIGLCRPYLWMLLAVTASIVGLGRYMCEARNADVIISVARRWGGKHGRMWSLIAIPAVIGLVPMPAGALFSAPMIQQTVGEDHWEMSWKVAVNYWFRHAWEYWWPIYPSVIVALAVFQMETWQYISTLIVFTPATLFAGYWFLLRPRRKLLLADQSGNSKSDRSLLIVMLPLGIMMFCALLLPPVLALILPEMDMQTRKLLAMLIGMGMALAVIMRDVGEKGAKSILGAMTSAATLNILLTVGSVILFQDMLKASNLLPRAGNELLASGIPLLLVVGLLPMLAGLITGIGIGFTGIAFPLVVGLMNVEGSGLTPMATLTLAFVSGYMGLMMSPVHLCLLLTRDFFAASLFSVYRHIIPCVFAIFACMIAVFGMFHALGL